MSYRLGSIICCFFSFLLVGQSQNSNLLFDHIGQRQGLIDAYNDFVYKDSQGYVWISSLSGIYKYDGLEIKHYKPPQAKGMLGKNIQSAFFEDSRRDIWFATVKGINRYKRDSDDFDYFQIKDAKGKAIEDSYGLFSIEYDSLLWLRAGRNIYTYDIKTERLDTIVSTSGYRFAVSKNSSGRIQSIVACPWIVEPGIQYIRIDEENRIESHKYLDQPGKKGESYIVSGAIVQSDSMVWLCSDQGLIAFNPENPEVKITYSLFGRKDFAVEGVLIGTDLYLTTKYSGVAIFSTKSRKLVKTLKHDDDLPNSLIDNSIRAVYLDNQEHLWVSSSVSNNIDHSWFKKNKFIKPFDLLGIKSSKINSIVEGIDQRLWVSTFQNGIFVFNRKTEIENQYSYETNGKVDLETIKELSKDKNGRVWAISDRKIYLFENQEPIQINYASTPSLLFHSLIHITNNKKLLSTDKGLKYITIYKLHNLASEDYAVDLLKLNPDISSLLPPKMFRHSNGDIYVPNQASELVILQYRDSTIKIWRKYKTDFEVYSIWEENENQVLLGTSLGVYRLDTERDELEKLFGEEKEIADVQVYSILGEKNGDFWFTTNQGIRHYNAKSDELHTYWQEDGYNSNQFELYANTKDSQGQFWIGTTNGLIGFHPDSIRPNPYGPNVSLKGLKINFEELNLNKGFRSNPRLDLEHFQNTLEFDFVALNNHLSKYNRLTYRLLNENERWQSVKNGEPINFSSLQPGDYKLEVYAENANGIKGKTYELPIIISPHILKTAKFWIPMGSVLLFSILYGFRLYTRRKLRLQQEEFERKQAVTVALQKEKERIASEMHDDIGGNLSSIQILLGKIDLGSAQAKEELKKIKNYTNTSVEGMRDIIWTMNSSKDNLPDLVADIRRFIIELFDDHKIECKVANPQNIPDISVSGQKRRNIYLSIKEAANNIIKHANATEVKVDIENNENFSVYIHDNGDGFDRNNLKPQKGGNGLRNMEKRMKEIGGEFKLERENGTKLSFIFPLNGPE